MPYINEEAREALAAGAPACHVGELNYVITRIINDYVKKHGLSYSVLNDVVGVLGLIRSDAFDYTEPVAAPLTLIDVTALTRTIRRLLNEYAEMKGFSHLTSVAVDGVLGSVTAEFQRRLVEPYEDRKREENGEVFDPELLVQVHTGWAPAESEAKFVPASLGGQATTGALRPAAGDFVDMPAEGDDFVDLPADDDRLRVYLAGGAYSDWRTRLTKELPIVGYDPFGQTPQWAAYLFVQGDLEAITESDLVIAYYPGGYASHGMAAEIAWAVAHQVPVFYVDETDAPDTFLLGLAKRFFPSLAALVRWWKDRDERHKPIL